MADPRGDVAGEVIGRGFGCGGHDLVFLNTPPFFDKTDRRGNRYHKEPHPEPVEGRGSYGSTSSP